MDNLKSLYTALIIGCGHIGSKFDEDAQSSKVYSHAGALTRSPFINLAALCDVDEVRLHEAMQYWRVTDGYGQVEEALHRTNPDVVVVATPDGTHAAVCRKVIRHSSVRAIIVEKPLAMSSSEGAELVRAASEAQVLLLVNYSRRYSAAFQDVRRQLKSGRIGDIQAVHGYYSKGLLHNGSHWLDLARWLVGEYVVRWSERAEAEIDADPELNLGLEFASGAFGKLTGLSQQHYYLFEMDILGTNGRLRIHQGSHFDWFTVGGRKGFPGIKELIPQRNDLPIPGCSMLSLVENLLDCLRGGAVPICGGEDALRVIQLVEEARERCSN